MNSDMNLCMGALPACHGRAGWKNGEEALLFNEVAKGRADGIPLKAVFEAVAEKTGRKPNSIRNYYYARVKEGGMAAAGTFHCAAFVPFKEDEIRSLLRTVLAAQAKGVSVRACTLSMGQGDTKTMLRYQNKYRALLRTNPILVQEVLRELEAEGVPAFDPYAKGMQRRGSGRRIGAANQAEDAARALAKVKDVDGEALFHAIAALAQAAQAGVKAEGEGAQLRARCAELKERLSAQEHALAAQRERFNKLLALFRQMMEANRAFLAQTEGGGAPALGAYVGELTRSVEDCERILSMLS